MISKKVISLVLIPMLMVSLVLSFLSLNLAQAQDESVILACPIQGTFAITSDLVGKNLTVEDSLAGTFTIENGSAYLLAGVSIGIGIYESATSPVPNFWTVLPNKVDLLPQAGSVVEADLNLSALPAGEYIVKLFIGQGDELDLFGIALRDVDTVATFIINKVTPSTADIDLTFSLNGKPAAANNQIDFGKTSALEAIAKNNGTLPITNAKLVTVLTQGSVPLASAVIKSEVGNLKLIPNGVQTIKLADGALLEGDYTAYVLVSVENALQPVEAIKIKVGDRDGVNTWPYISLLGISDFPTTAESEIVACVNYLGTGALARQAHSVLGVEFTGVAGAAELFSNKVSNLDGSLAMFFSQKIGASSQDLKITASLLEDTNGSLMYAGTEPEGVQIAPIDYLVTTQTIELILTCSASLGCEPKSNDTTVENYLPTGPTEPFWFYAGVVIAALLLMYLMLRRLNTSGTELNSKLSDSELQ